MNDWVQVLLLAALAVGSPSGKAPSDQEDAALRHARELLRSTPLVDGHNDTVWLIREDPTSHGDVSLYDMRKPGRHETDLARLRAGGVSAQFWSVWIPSLSDGSARMQLEQIDLARRMIAAYPEVLVFATRAADIRAAQQAGKIASFLGMENGRALENSFWALRAYYALGVRYMTLTHGRDTDWADSATDDAKHGGLTPFGREVVREMNRLGMLVDLSHVSAAVMKQALDVSEAPVIFSHSSARALTDHPRNVPDDVLRRMPANGGVVMVTFVPPLCLRSWRNGTGRWKGRCKGPRPLQRCDDWRRSARPSPGHRRRPHSLKWPTTLNTSQSWPASTTLASAVTSTAMAAQLDSRT